MCFPFSKVFLNEEGWIHTKYKSKYSLQKTVTALASVLSSVIFADFKQSRRSLDAGVAERIFTFSFDILDNWEEKGNLHNFEAHMKLRSTVFLKVRWGDSPSSNQA